MKNIEIGFWFNPHTDKDYPLPLANTSTEEEKVEMLDSLTVLLGKATMHSYRGPSYCRICERINGSQEYHVSTKNTKAIIPEGLSHYITHHNVLIPQLLKSNIEMKAFLQ
jgi:hypothetical protein